MACNPLNGSERRAAQGRRKNDRRKRDRYRIGCRSRLVAEIAVKYPMIAPSTPLGADIISVSTQPPTRAPSVPPGSVTEGLSNAFRRGWGESTSGIQRKVLRRLVILKLSQKLF